MRVVRFLLPARYLLILTQDEKRFKRVMSGFIIDIIKNINAEYNCRPKLSFTIPGFDNRYLRDLSPSPNQPGDNYELRVCFYV